MKWYFAINQASLLERRDLWERLITAAVASARAKTTLKPHLIYDGGQDPFIAKLSRFGVKIVPHKVSFNDALVKHSPDDPMYERIASGAFLRTELPLLAYNDEVVLYTDCDIIFERDPDVTRTPALFACAPEFFQQDYVNFNTGVMLMNIRALRESHLQFREFIISNLAKFATFDQDAYKLFYGNRVEHLPLTMNWKPYWGVNPRAEIVHFHGPKPDWVQKYWAGEEGEEILVDLVGWKPEGYRHYVRKWNDDLNAIKNVTGAAGLVRRLRMLKMVRLS